MRVVAFLVCCSPLAAQATWNMGAPWTDLRAVFAMAAPGDVVRLNGLEFGPFALTKGLTVLGPGAIRPFTPAPLAHVTTIAVPAGQRGHFVAVDFTPIPLMTIGSHRVEVTGAATFEECEFVRGMSDALVANGAVSLRDCTIRGMVDLTGLSGGGLRVSGGVCSLVGCTVLGANAQYSGIAAAVLGATPAVRMHGGALLMSDCTVRGGNGYASGFWGSTPGASAIVVGSGTVWLADCDVLGGSSPAPFAGAVGLAGTASTFVARTTLVGGTGTPIGASSSGPIVPLPQLPGLRTSGALRLGSTVTFTATAGNAQLLGVLAGFDATVSTHPAVVGPIVGSLQAMSALTLAAAPLAGTAVPCALVVPNTASLTGTGVFVQAFQLDGTLVRASAAAGGVVH